MKTLSIKKHILFILTTLLVMTVLMSLVSCEQEGVEPELAAAPGGGTISTYKAYALDSIPGMKNVYGRIVFWKDNASNTLVQVSLYNTKNDIVYPTGIYAGTVGGGSLTELMSLYAVDGASGEFGSSKFYVIGNKDFYNDLDEMDAYIRILSGTDLVASGNFGSNADPVATGE